MPSSLHTKGSPREASDMNSILPSAWSTIVLNVSNGIILTIKPLAFVVKVLSV